MTLPNYEVFAIKYAQRDARRAEHFIGGDPHDASMPMDYFVWLIQGEGRVVVVDTGFSAAMAAQRKREYLRSPKEGLALLGVDAGAVPEVIISHMHYDHSGTLADFANARFHIQEKEMDFVTGRYMRFAKFRNSFEVDDVTAMLRMIYSERVDFHQGAADLAPGISVHFIGGHTMGLQSVRVHTQRGWVVLAADSSHYYEHFETGRLFPTAFNLGEMLEGFDTLRNLAESPQHVVPGHDPLVMKRYPAVSKELEGIAVRLDVAPIFES